MKRVSMAVILAAGIVAGQQAKADILIGLQAPITGPEAAGGEQLRRGFEQAIKDINAKGGVLGQPLKGVIGDDACEPKQAVSVANKFATEGVVFVDGGYCSGSSIPASAVYFDAGILQITPSSTSPTLTDDAFAKGWQNVYRTCGRNDQQGQTAGKYIAEKYAGVPVAIVDDKSTYGKSLADATRQTLNALGVKEVDDDEITAGDKDYSALVTKLKALNTGVIYFGGYVTEAGLIARQTKEAGLNAVIMSGDTLPSPDFWTIAGAAGNGTLFTFSPDPLTNPSGAEVMAEFKQQGFVPEGFTLYSYATVQIFAQAAAIAKSLKLADLAKAMHSKTFSTVLGNYTYDKKGDPNAGGYVVWQWKDGSYHVL